MEQDGSYHKKYGPELELMNSGGDVVLVRRLFEEFVEVPTQVIDEKRELCIVWTQVYGVEQR